MTKQDIQLLAGPAISFNPAFARVAGSVTAGLMLTQLNYWTGKEKSGDGWIYKTREQMEEETTLSRTEQETARRRLQQLNLLEVKLKGVPAKLHYWIDYDELARRLSLLKTADLDCNNPSLQETRHLDCGNSANQIAENPQSITKTTAETTPEITGQIDIFHSSLIERSVGTPNRAEQGAAGKPPLAVRGVAVEYPPPSPRPAESFEAFWKLYPRREHRKQAAQSWGKLSAAEKSAAMADIPKRLVANWAGREIRYLPHAATYLNQRMWEDELMRRSCTHGGCGAGPCRYLNGNAAGSDFTSRGNPYADSGASGLSLHGATVAIPERDVMNPERYPDEDEETWAYRMNDRWKILHPETGLPSPEYMAYVARREAARDEWYRKRGQL